MSSLSPPWLGPWPVEGDRPVRRIICCSGFSLESGCLGVQPKVRRKLDVRLNMTPRPIVNKYCVGKLKRTLKREFNSTWNCVVVNGGVSRSLYRRFRLTVAQQWCWSVARSLHYCQCYWRLHFSGASHDEPLASDRRHGWSSFLVFEPCVLGFEVDGDLSRHV